MSQQHDPAMGLRRIVTGTNAAGRSHILIDGPPAETHDVASLHEIWTDAASGPIDRAAAEDLGKGKVQLTPPPGGVKIRWFIVRPRPEGISDAEFRSFVKDAFADIGAADHQPDTTRHAAMHLTPSLDAIILIRGRVRLILDEEETVISPGDVVVQRATNHAWVVEGDAPALFVAVLIDREDGS
ncbi:MAG: cupin domain-containing protein [Hyphomonadaceae bacterium]|nr:cupin domain-containing protein [Hyphomonadaceae bacterium]